MRQRAGSVMLSSGKRPVAVSGGVIGRPYRRYIV
jgi:hypothetical protein